VVGDGRRVVAAAEGVPGDDCGWAFYDRSVNASATWCSMRVCGQRAKARSYYRRSRGD
jgi:predicted RNA-binding Zn ribbon-like protein